MNSASRGCSTWTRGRFLGVAGALFALQTGLVFLFGGRSHPAQASASLSIHCRALAAPLGGDELLRWFFAGDPAVFPLPNHHGFSGRGWLDQQPPAYQAEYELESPSPLRLDAALLGTNFPVLPLTRAALAEQPVRQEEPPPAFLAPEVDLQASSFRLIGLQDRLLGAGPVLRAWPSTRILTNSPVQIAVNSSGEVVSARLEAGCGLAEADAEAVAQARALRFRPTPSAGTQWGEAVFQWQTTEAPATAPAK